MTKDNLEDVRMSVLEDVSASVENNYPKTEEELELEDRLLISMIESIDADINALGISQSSDDDLIDFEDEEELDNLEELYEKLYPISMENNISIINYIDKIKMVEKKSSKLIRRNTWPNNNTKETLINQMIKKENNNNLTKNKNYKSIESMTNENDLFCDINLEFAKLKNYIVGHVDKNHLNILQG
ncbi:hypothetical protein HCN44_009592 [Aphidius gifuensis]|uniref:Uncharacterized protein n=1 Tax=Aphidius gifuensis TaxID=684658 RepID=A0A835CWC0_APHGI|nr:uncharacterized protein LOC122860369 [Aphidius gifuensis]KAF7998194.1 hypothetical protein HCN44_009592 [Aphidius gifuensis]